MKRITFFIIALFALSTISAQQGQQGNQEEFSKFYEETIKPELEKQQKDFFAILSKAEIKELKTLSLQANEIHTQFDENNTTENRFDIRDKMMSLRDQAEKIADAHSEQSEKYRKNMSENMEKWRAEMPKRNFSKDQKNNQGRGNGQGQGQGQVRGNKQGQKGNGNGQGQAQSQGNGQGQGNRGGQNMSSQQGGMQMLQQLTDPAWLLLWSADRNPQMMMHAGRNGMSRQNPLMNNPELKAELQDYFQKNILPQIAEKRKLFDEKLSPEEKTQITQAAGMTKTRDAMQKSYMESEDFDPGSRRNDTDFAAFRDGMQKNMMEMRKISTVHADEITEIRNSLKPQYDQWLSDIEKIFSKYNDDKFAAGEMLSRAFKQNTSPMAFILFDAENSQFWSTNRGGPANGMHGNNNGNRNRF